MKIAWIDAFSETSPDAVIGELRKRGIEVAPEPDGSTDLVINGSIAKQEKAWEYQRTGYPIINYCWDYYQWAKDGKHQHFNWPKYEMLLRRSADIWVPSTAQQKRLSEWEIPSHVIRTDIKVYDHETGDGRFVLDPVRYYEHDPQCYWARDACGELGIPFVHSEHQFTTDEFRKLVSTCTLMTCGYAEASTGGLTLVEGLWNGKPSLVSDSPYMGARDYLGPYGHYFAGYEDLKRKLKEMFLDPPQVDISAARSYISANYSPEAMAKAIENRLCELKNSLRSV